jgi:hypothetical protein
MVIFSTPSVTGVPPNGLFSTYIRGEKGPVTPEKAKIFGPETA